MSSGSSFSETSTISGMAVGVMITIRPAIQRLDAQVLCARDSQVLLAAKIQDLSDILHDMRDNQPYELDSYSRKLDDSKRRVVNTGKILENIQERLVKLQCEVSIDRQLKGHADC